LPDCWFADGFVELFSQRAGVEAAIGKNQPRRWNVHFLMVTFYDAQKKISANNAVLDLARLKRVRSGKRLS
jgi:hypothetical protein